ncbi:hypothetical protein GCM10017557_04240 [Streptomyces aurantiacus]|uniref:Uncharacterized protein n=1 Tax=Streptomyces aurantiacus TaxID=47760 RepID=A0A7G1NXC0_9ACTN|nr:hypothetical protein GCM10017557_04240 [Streptomyces aurantiacus]
MLIAESIHLIKGPWVMEGECLGPCHIMRFLKGRWLRPGVITAEKVGHMAGSTGAQPAFDQEAPRRAGDVPAAGVPPEPSTGTTRDQCPDKNGIPGRIFGPAKAWGLSRTENPSRDDQWLGASRLAPISWKAAKSLRTR